MLSRATLGLLVVTGCGFQSRPATTAGDDAMVDGAVGDDSGSGSGTDFCLGDAMVTACLAAPPTQPLVINSATVIDTDVPGSCATNAVGASTQYCILAGSTITIMGGKTLSAHGNKPLVLMSSGMITVSGAIDVAGHLAGVPQVTGPGAAACTLGTAPVNNGGGYGGSFGSFGGVGGVGDTANAGGVPPLFAAPTTFRGGCAGQAGLNAGGGVAGPAGGAVALLSSTKIQIDGAINASGGGGAAPTANNRGGGGGGAGGMIVVDAPMVTGGGGAKIFANGGSGGEGRGGLPAMDGNDPTDLNKAAVGGKGGGTGGDGGDGALKSALAGDAAGPGGTGTSTAGGGGGGGGVGVIRLYKGASLPGTVSPPPAS